jgi:hypothetical protein
MAARRKSVVCPNIRLSAGYLRNDAGAARIAGFGIAIKINIFQMVTGFLPE